MKRSKREENWIIIHLAFYSILTLSLIFYISWNLYSTIKEIELNKSLTIEIQSNLNRINESWLNYDEFKETKTDSKTSKLTLEILKSMTKDFYNNNLINKEYPSYDEFLSNKESNLNSDENKAIVTEKKNKIKKILPWYTDNTITINEYTLTDYRFINYIESLIESFNLTTNDSLWIKKLKLLEDYTISKTIWNWLDTNIFYIPLNLTLNWSKSSILDFLYFIENVWNIKLENNNIVLNTAYEELSTNWFNKVLVWDINTPEYNIFEHQIFDIENISINEYMDRSYSFRWDKDFKEFIVKTQWNDDFTITLDLMFYLKWEKAYEIEDFINKVFAHHNTALSLIAKELKNTNLKGVERINLSKSNTVLKEFTKEIILLKKSLSKKDKLEEIYKRSLQIDSVVDPIYISLGWEKEKKEEK